MGRIDSVGYDSTGRSNNGIELERIERDFTEFLEREDW